VPLAGCSLFPGLAPQPPSSSTFSPSTSPQPLELRVPLPENPLSQNEFNLHLASSLRAFLYHSYKLKLARWLPP
jgi:hypothetical protein